MLHCSLFVNIKIIPNSIKLTYVIHFVGDPPLAIARGGFSGIFPDSSLDAYQLALITGLPDMILWCDVQLTSDGAGICFPEVTLNNGSDIGALFNQSSKTYLVNGVSRTGWFSVDFTLDALTNVSCKSTLIY